MHLTHYLQLLREGERELATALRTVADAHTDEIDVVHTARLTASWCDAHVAALAPVCERYAVDDAPDAPGDLHFAVFEGPREGGIGVLRDLHDLYLQATACDITWTLVGQAAKGLRDGELLGIVRGCEEQTTRTLQWLSTVMKTSATQALVVA